MKKTFKRSIACLLAVLMVVFSVPFTASAGIIEKDYKWWTAEGISDDEIEAYLQENGEPQYTTLNSVLEDEGEDPLEEFGAYCGYDYDGHDIRENYMPVLAVVVSDQGTATLDEDGNQLYLSGSDTLKAYDNAIRNQYYGYSKTYNYDKVSSAGNILNPADLEAGQRIAITIEIGGFDSLYSMTMTGTYDNEYLQPAYYSGTNNAKNGDTWTAVDCGDGVATTVLQTTNKYYSAGGATGGQLVRSDGDWQTSYVSTAMTTGEGYSSYLGYDLRQDLFESKYGLYTLTLSFEVLQDCDLKDVFFFNEGDAGVIMEAYNREILDEDANLFNICYGNNNTAFALWAEVWDSYEEVETTTHTHDFTDAEAVSNDDGTHTYTCTAADCDLSDGYQTTENCTYTYEVTTEATYTSAGVGTYTCTECGYSYTEAIPALSCAHDGETYVTGAVAATCVAEGYTGDTYCSICNQLITAGETIDATGVHTWEETTAQVDATCTSTGTTAIETCSVCGAVQGGEEIAMTDHVTEIQNAVDATCGTDGYTGDEVCTVCGETVSTGEAIAATGHDYQVTDSKDATCTEDGYTTYTCTKCDDTYTDTIDALGHTTEVQNAVAATCTTDGYTGDEVCTVCGETIATGETIAATGHSYVVTDSKDATYDAAGYITYTCENCDDTYTVPLAQLEGVDITVTAQDLGTVTLNGTDVTDGATITVDKNSTVTLVATPVDGATFVGWVANDSTTVSTDTTFTPVALADITYEPVFEIESDGTFTVTFVDSYGNVVYSKTVSDASEIEIPDGPARAGYTFTGWSVDASTVTASTTIVAQYTAAETTGYTVTATGCDITVNGETVTDVATGLAYDTLVTVTYSGAVAWTTPGNDGDVTVGYGESYSFYVGADITLTPVTDSSVVTVAPTVAAVDAYQIDGSYQFSFLATRSMTDECTYVNAGYIYGLGDLTADDLTLDNVDGSTIRASYCKTSVEQFALNVGIKAQSGSISACAFLAYVDAAGTTQVIYADVQHMSY